jgi:hypothetical protein
MDRRTDGQTDKQTNRETMDGQIERQKESIPFYNFVLEK